MVNQGAEPVKETVCFDGSQLVETGGEAIVVVVYKASGIIS